MSSPGEEGAARPDTEDTMERDEIIAISKALSNETRYKILREIPADGQRCCKDLSECFGISKPTVTHHINKLRNLGLLKSFKEQTYHYLTRNQEKLSKYRRALAEDFRGPSSQN
jgi:ArsR family transcriptional regulator